VLEIKPVRGHGRVGGSAVKGVSEIGVPCVELA
jgi:hypothetical protein